MRGTWNRLALVYRSTFVPMQVNRFEREIVMLVVKVELWPYGMEEQARVLADAQIALQAEDKNGFSYRAELTERGEPSLGIPPLERVVEVHGYDRRQSVWNLVREVLEGLQEQIRQLPSEPAPGNAGGETDQPCPHPGQQDENVAPAAEGRWVRGTTAPAAETIETTDAGLRTFFRLAAAWDLTPLEQAKVLGVDECTTDRFREADYRLATKEVLLRISCLLGIYRAINILLPQAPHADTWIKKPNSAPVFGGARAIDKMTTGDFHDLLEVRRYLDAQVNA